MSKNKSRFMKYEIDALPIYILLRQNDDFHNAKLCFL